jgi:hypothetical protein
MNVNTSLEERTRAPAWLASWGKIFGRYEKEQLNRAVYRCPRCAARNVKDHNPHQYGITCKDFRVLQFACGHFIKRGDPVPEAV